MNFSQKKNNNNITIMTFEKDLFVEYKALLFSKYQNLVQNPNFVKVCENSAKETLIFTTLGCKYHHDWVLIHGLYNVYIGDQTM